MTHTHPAQANRRTGLSDDGGADTQARKSNAQFLLTRTNGVHQIADLGDQQIAVGKPKRPGVNREADMNISPVCIGFKIGAELIESINGGSGYLQPAFAGRAARQTKSGWPG